MINVMGSSIGDIREALSKTGKVLSQDALEMLKQTGSTETLINLSNRIENSLKEASLATPDYTGITERLKEAGIANLKTKDDNICILTRKGNFFRIKPSMKLYDDAAKIFVLGEVESHYGFYGIPAFIDFVDTMRRFDILKNGLGLSSNEISPLDEEKRHKIAAKLSKKLDKYVSYKDFFANTNEAFYFDKSKKTVYGARLSAAKLKDKDISTCKFLSDETGNIIGYEKTDFDLLSEKMKTRTYIEPQEQTLRLPEIVDPNEPNYFAQVCRFGNFTPGERYDEAKKVIFDRLERGGIQVPKDNYFKGIKFLQDGRKNVMFSYYNPNNGRSILFSKEGDLIKQIEYIRNQEGDIINSFHVS